MSAASINGGVLNPHRQSRHATWSILPKPPSARPSRAAWAVSKLSLEPTQFDHDIRTGVGVASEQARVEALRPRTGPCRAAASIENIAARSISLWRPSEPWKASSASSSAFGGQAESCPHAVQGLGEMLHDGANANWRSAVPGEPSPDQPKAHGQVPWAGRPWSRRVAPACADAAQHARVVKPSRFSRINRLPEGFSVLQIGRPCHEQRVVIGQRSNERRIDREVVGRRMAGAAGAAIAVERLFHEQPAALDQLPVQPSLPASFERAMSRIDRGRLGHCLERRRRARR